MDRVLLFLIGLAVFLATGYAGVHAPDTGVAARIEARLQAAAEAALRESGLDDWAQVRVDGQTAWLTGDAPREEDRGDARAAVFAAAGPGGWWRGGVTAVQDRTVLAATLSPFVWSATVRDRQVTLSGGAPSRAARTEIRQYATELFPGGVMDDMRVARGAPDEQGWNAAAQLVLSQLSRLSEGRAAIVDLAITLEGAAASEDDAERVRQAMGRAPAVFAREVRVRGLGPSAAAPRPEAASTVFASPEACAAALNQRAGEGDLGFSGAARIAKETYPTLDGLAAIANRCPGRRITVRAQAPAGSDDAARERARDRAQAIADYLVLKGLAASRSAADVVVQHSAGDAPDFVSYIFVVDP